VSAGRQPLAAWLRSEQAGALAIELSQIPQPLLVSYVLGMLAGTCSDGDGQLDPADLDRQVHLLLAACGRDRARRPDRAGLH